MVKRITWLALAVWLCAQVAIAGEVKIEPRTVVLIVAENIQGSGVYLGSQLVLTAHHVVRGKTTARVTFKDGPTIFAKCIAKDPKWDQALLELVSDPKMPAAPISQQADIERGKFVEAGGWAGVGQWKGKQAYSTGRVTDYKTCAEGETAADWVIVAATVVDGMSGGPVFNDQGEVLGVLWGTDMKTTAFCRPCRTRLFLRPWRARLVAVQTRPPQTICGPNGCYPVIPSAPPPGTRRVYDPQPSIQPSIEQPLVEIPDTTPTVPQVDLTDLTARITALETSQAAQDERITALEGQTSTAADAAQAASQTATDAKTAAESAASGVAGLTTRVTAFEAQIGSVQTGSEQAATAIQQAIQSQTDLLQQIETMQTQLIAIQQQLKTDQAAASNLDDVMLYYTSREVSGLTGVDAKIMALKDKGAPIVVTYLKPSQAEVFGIPRIFIPSQNKNVVGVANCEYYLASLLPR